MTGCEACIVVVAYVVLAFGILDWLDLRSIARRLDKIEDLLGGRSSGEDGVDKS